MTDPANVEVTNVSSADIFVIGYGMVETSATETVPNTEQVQQLIALGAFSTAGPVPGPAPTSVADVHAIVPRAQAHEGFTIDVSNAPSQPVPIGTDGLPMLSAASNVKRSVKAASVTNHSFGAAGSRTIDGYSCAAGDRVLLMAQTAGAENGIYIVGSNFALTRASDADTAAELVAAVVLVERGSTNADKEFQQTVDTITLGTTALVWSPIADTSLSLSKSANLSDVTDTGTARANLRVPALLPAQVVATANVSSRSGLQTIDGVTLTDGDQVLLVAQTTASQNGPWVAHGGAWTRPTDFPSGASVKGRTITVLGGTGAPKQYALQVGPGATVTVDTTAQTWAALSAGSGIPVGGTSGQVLKKNSGADGDASWASVAGGFGLPQFAGDRLDDGSEYGAGFQQPSAINAPAPLTIPTYDGSGQCVHPDVAYYPKKWNGWRYWMLFEPYPSAADVKENPSIVVSNDGDTWQVPDGLTNPVVAEPSGFFYSDGCLVKSQDGLTLHMVYRKSSGGGGDLLLIRSSTDGINWSAAQTILTGAVSTLASPSIVFYGGKWHMWYCDLSSGTAANRTVMHATADALTGPWSAAEATNLTGNSPGGLVTKNIWHLQVVVYGEKLHMLLYATGTPNTLHFGTASDPLSWAMAPTPVISGISGSWDESMYRACMVPAREPGATYFDIFYSARTVGGSGTWRIGRTRLNFTRPKMVLRPGRWYDAPRGGSRTTRQFAINELRAVPLDCQAATLTGLALEVTTAAAAGALLRYGLYLDDGEGAPGRLLRDLGTFAGDSTGQKAVTGLYVGVPSGTLWLAAVAQVSPATIKAIDGDGGTNVEGIGGHNAAGALGVGRASYKPNGTVDGALPATFVVNASSEQYGPRAAVLLEKK